jgi:hypothetical protein
MDPATRALLEAMKARQDIVDARLEIMARRLDELEGEPSPEVVRIPKFKLRDINARLEGDDIA